MKTFILILTLYSTGMREGVGGVTSMEIHGGVARCQQVGKEWMIKLKAGGMYKEDHSFYMCVPK